MSNAKEMCQKLRTAFMDCIEYEGKSLTEWDEICQAREQKDKSLALKKENERISNEKRQENIKNYREQVDKLSRYDAIGQFIDLSGELDRSNVHIDADGQYRANMAFASAIDIDLED